MKKTFLALLAIFVSLIAMAQDDRPVWTVKTPKPGNDTYVYDVEYAWGKTAEEARNNAISQVYQSTIMRLGTIVSLNKVSQGSLPIVDSSIIFNIPVNKVCEYTTVDKDRGGYIVYVLCQVAKNGSVYPDWDYYKNCNKIYRRIKLK